MNFNNVIKIDLDADANTLRYEAADAELYVRDASEIARNINKGGNGSTMTLESAEYEQGIIASSKLDVKQTTRPETIQFIWAYNGSAKFRPDTDLSTDTYYGQLEELLEDVDGYSLEPYYFSNTRLLVAERSGALAVISYYQADRQLRYSNNFRATSPRRKNIKLDLEAPTLAELENAPVPQMVDHVRGYMLAVNAVPTALNMRPRLPRLLLTPDGPYYPTAKKNRYAKKPVELPENEVVEELAKGGSRAVREEVKPGIKLDDIGGLEQIRAELKRVALSFKHPETMARWGAERPQGVFLYGPPGTGKTTLARALASEIGGDLWEIKSSEIYSKWLGESEKNIEALFAQAHTKTEPTVMLFDEFESLIQGEDGDSGTGRTANAVVGIFKREVTKLRESNPNIILVAASNHPDKIDESLMRAGRFDVKAYVPLPETEARVQILSNNIADRINALKTEGFSPFADDLDIPALAAMTDGMSGADLVEVVRRASFDKAMKEATTQQVSPITQQDLLNIITEIRHS